MHQRCIVWGAGKYGQRLMEMLDKEYDIAAYCDMSIELLDKKLGKYEIVSIEKAIEMCIADKNLKIIIAIFDQDNIKEVKKIIENKFPRNTEVIVAHDIQDKIENKKLEAYHRNMHFKWEVDLEKYFFIWLDNIMSEVEFWIKSVADSCGRMHKYNISCRENTKFVHPGISPKIKANEIVLDIGCGLMSRYGNELDDGKAIQLIPVDALAYFYNMINGRIQDELKGDYVCRFGLFEFLGNIFGRNYADYIIINNALDHGIDPWRSIVECLYVLKLNGSMHLEHRRAEAVFEDWNGLHKWNIDCANGDMLIWNKENAINVTESLKGLADVYVKYDDSVSARERQSVRVEIIKKKKFELRDFFDMYQENHILTGCIEKLMKKLASDNIHFYNMLNQVLI